MGSCRRSLRSESADRAMAQRRDDPHVDGPRRHRPARVAHTVRSGRTFRRLHARPRRTSHGTLAPDSRAPAGIGFPVVADEFYSASSTLRLRDLFAPTDGRAEINHTNGAPNTVDSSAAILLSRQALHARSLRFVHPITGELVTSKRRSRRICSERWMRCAVTLKAFCSIAQGCPLAGLPWVGNGKCREP